MDITVLSVYRKEVLSSHGKTERDMTEYIGILREWMKKMPHIPSYLLQDSFLEIHLIKNKFSLEKTKNKIENYCNLKSSPRYQYLYEDCLVIPSKEPQFYIPILKLTDEFYRIMIGRIWDEEKWDIKREFSNTAILREFSSRYDYSNGDIIVMDFYECSMKLVSKFRANVISDGLLILRKGHSARLKEIHIISKLASTILPWCKSFLPSKIFSRIFAHENRESLSKFIPAKYLPKDYGGELKSLDEMRGM
ncbi:hypothetical protein WA026_021743 [Henosepilachna vigintioctopunctata]|uniref:CRAL-TRIO domain-containing protein n=1 Tax=Henosepilachna vigintioctopunctata TaxID=420089 RepID=A0AAW1TX05_9CUCU